MAFYNEGLKTRQLNSDFDQSNFRSIFKLDADSVFLSNMRLLNVSCIRTAGAAEATNSPYNRLCGSYGLIKSIQLTDGGTVLDELREANIWSAFQMYLKSNQYNMSMARKLNGNGQGYVMNYNAGTEDTPKAAQIQQFLNAGFLFKSYIVWNKNNSTFGRSDYHWKHEPCIYGWLEGASHKWYGDRKQTTVWDIERPSRSDEHPTMKPIPLCSKPLENSSKQGDIILDVFLGSGSTMVASHQLKRKCYGMELDPKYCQVIIDRMKKLDPTLVIKRNGKAI